MCLDVMCSAAQQKMAEKQEKIAVRSQLKKVSYRI